MNIEFLAEFLSLILGEERIGAEGLFKSLRLKWGIHRSLVHTRTKFRESFVVLGQFRNLNFRDGKIVKKLSIVGGFGGREG